jgi:hypothetical protein
MKAKRKLPSGKLVVGPSRRDQAVLDESGLRSESVLFDFDNDGGAVGDVEFARNLPAGAIVTKIISDEITTVTAGAGATLTLKAGSTSLSGAIAFDTGLTGIDNQALAGAVDGIKLSAASELKLTIATNALTAGKVRFYVEYLLAND